MRKKQNRRDYTEQFKTDAVNLVLNQNYSRSEVGRRLGVHQAKMHALVHEYKQRSEGNGNDHLSARQLQEENKRLKKEVQRLTMKREILKKAAVFFAKESS